jgi:hypothetical protein
MSRAGKFVPGGGGANKAKRTGPIRAPEAGGSELVATTPGSPKKNPLAKGGSLRQPVAKNQRTPILVMSALVLCLLVSAGWYVGAYLPMKRSEVQLQAQIEADRKKAADDEAARKAKEAADAKAAAEAAAARGTLIVNTTPAGAKATIGDFTRTTPATFDQVPVGAGSVLIQADGYEDYHADVTIANGKPLDLGTITLAPKTGGLSLTSSQAGAAYSITGPNGYMHEGQVPDKLDHLPVGDYSITASLGDWKLPPVTATVRDHDTVTSALKFPYAKVQLTSTPPGATVRQGRNVLGQTPLTLTTVRPGDVVYTLDLPPYTLQRVEFTVSDFGSVTKAVTLAQDKDFVAGCGMPLVWISDGGYWASKYLVRQGEFEKVAGYNPSNFRGSNRPVETISWDGAQAFIARLNAYEQKAGKLPNGFHYSLPRESQWEQFNDDAKLEDAATSRVTPLTSTQDCGYSGPNKYGLYDTLGNVWELCQDDFDDRGDHTLRGGTWLSLPENFSGTDARQGAPSKYADRFIGFRVVLVPNS